MRSVAAVSFSSRSNSRGQTGQEPSCVVSFCEFFVVLTDHRTMAHHVNDVTPEPKNYTTPRGLTAPRSGSASDGRGSNCETGHERNQLNELRGLVMARKNRLLPCGKAVAGLTPNKRVDDAPRALSGRLLDAGILDEKPAHGASASTRRGHLTRGKPPIAPGHPDVRKDADLAKRPRSGNVTPRHPKGAAGREPAGLKRDGSPFGIEPDTAAFRVV